MKRLAVVLLAALVLLSAVACQPTPEQEYVVNKKDSGAASKLENESAEVRDAQRVPDRWDEVYETDLMTLTFSAPIVQKDDGIYPVYRTRKVPLT